MKIPTYTIFTLDNHLPVILVPKAGTESITVLALANTGSRYEQPHQYGIAHFLEHMVFKGTACYSTASKLAATIDGVGADFNAFTSKEYTGYYVKAASRHTALALQVIAQMLLAPKLRQTDINREKGVVIEELHMYEDLPHRHVENLFDNLMYQGSGLEHDIVGNVKTISTFTQADLRAFLQQWYGFSNLVLVIAGDSQVIDAANFGSPSAKHSSQSTAKNIGKRKQPLLTWIETAFSQQTLMAVNHATLYKQKANTLIDKVKQKNTKVEQHNTRVEQKNNQFDPNIQPNMKQPSPYGQQKLVVKHRATEQAHFIIGWPGITRHSPDRYALTLLKIILGGNMSSRLFTEVREKRGLAYYVHADNDMNHDSGVFGAAAGVDPKRIKEALKVTINEFTALAAAAPKKAITPAELARAKEYIFGKITLNEEDSQLLAQHYGLDLLLTNHIETSAQIFAKIKQVTLPALMQLASKIIQPHAMRLAVIGPYQSAQFEKFVI